MAYEDIETCALYLRYSDRSQTEQSIEGQMRVCKEFCKRNNIRVAETYIDRATSARSTEHRTEFLRMVKDSEKHPWDSIIVYKLDRFARNRYDSATYKYRLKKNGVRLISATENLSDNPESIILESVLEGMAEFYSAELSQKITRGLHESALKCNSIGGHVPLGYRIENKKLVINPATAHIVQEAFELYANGETVADICRRFNLAGYRTAKNAEFNRNSFKSMFRNERYLGLYKYRDITVENGVPAIIDKDLWDKVQARLSVNAQAPARGKAKVDYLLSGKLFCGHCGAAMNGESGTGKYGGKYNYYTCYNRKRNRNCDKKPLPKDYIERVVVQDAMTLMTDSYIEELADMAMSQSEADIRENTCIPQLTEDKKSVQKSIDNIAKAIEKGVASETLMHRLTELEAQRKDIDFQLAEESKYIVVIEKPLIVNWLKLFQNGDVNNDDFKRHIINLLVNSVTVWDEPDGYKITAAYNLTSCKGKTYRVPKDGTPSITEGFGFEGLDSTIERISELFIAGLVIVQTKVHPLP